MRKIILYIAASLDGFIAKEDGSVDWLQKYESPSDDDYGYSAFESNIDTLLMGRKTYEQVLEFGEWPYKGKKCYVFTKKSIEDARVTAISNPIEFTKSLLDRDGKNIWLVGGSQIITLLMNYKLVDEIILTVMPVILGNGIPLFTNIASEINCKLLSEKSYKSGLIQMHYKIQ